MPFRPVGWLQRLADSLGLELDELLVALLALSITGLVALQVVVLVGEVLARRLGVR